MSRQTVNLDPKNKKIRRSVQIGETSLSGERIIQPRPPAFPSVNGGQEHLQLGEDGRPKKKRGRPSKEEHEQRVAEAALRGEVYPPPKKAKTPRPSLDAIVAMGLPGTVASSNEAGPSGSTSPTATKKKEIQFTPAPERSAAELTPGALSETTLQTSTTVAPPFTPVGLLPPPQQTGLLAPGKSPLTETQI